MPSERVFYKTKFSFEVLSEAPIYDGELTDILHDCIHGDFSMGAVKREQQELDGPAAAKALEDQGSDPEFFQLTPEGDDLDDDEDDEEPDGDVGPHAAEPGRGSPE